MVHVHHVSTCQRLGLSQAPEAGVLIIPLTSFPLHPYLCLNVPTLSPFIHLCPDLP